MNDQEKAIVPAGPSTVPAAFDFSDMDTADLKRKFVAIEQFQYLVSKQLKNGLDYGIIPGTGGKPTLLKPGAEKIAKLLNCFDEYEIVSSTEDWDRPLFRYMIRCTLKDMATGTRVSSGLGECNTWESKYRWRWVAESDIPAGMNKDSLTKRDGRKTLFEFDFAIEKRETTGPYGKPAEYWARFDEAIQNGTAVRKEKETKSKKVFLGHEIVIGQTLYRVPNPDVFDQINTVLKMSKKRAMVDAALSAGRLSDLFTQDLEDLFGDAAAQMDAPEPTPEPKPAPSPAPTPAPAAASPASRPAADRPASSGGPSHADNNEPGPDPAPPSDFPESKPETESRASDLQLSKIGLSMIALQKTYGVSPTVIMEQLYKNVHEKFKTTFAEFGELTAEEADYVGSRLEAWITHIKSEREKKAGRK